MSKKPDPKYKGQLLHWRRHITTVLNEPPTVNDMTHANYDEFYIADGSDGCLWWSGIPRDEFQKLENTQPKKEGAE